MISVYKTRMEQNVNACREGKLANFCYLLSSFLSSHAFLLCSQVYAIDSVLLWNDSRLESIEVEESRSR